MCNILWLKFGMRLIFCMQINIKIFRESIYVLLIYIVVIYVDVICSTAAKSNIYSSSSHSFFSKQMHISTVKKLYFYSGHL